jgi:uncharacterized protein with von Willebrand factor type A (vWA) domain
MGSEPAVQVGRIAELAARMRAAGAGVGIGQVLASHRALLLVDPSSREQVRAALRATLCSSRAEQEIFERSFAALFAGRPEESASPQIGVTTTAPGIDARPPDARDGREDEEDEEVGTWSAAHVLRHKDFSALDEREREMVRRTMARLARRAPLRPSPRTKPGRHRGTRIDVRATAREAIRHGGDPIELRWQHPTTRPRRLVMICDASRSMSAYTRPLLEYVQAAVAVRRRVEAFVFSTRLTRVTGELRGRDPDTALARAMTAVTDWDGGTRIGDSIAALNREHARWVGRGAIVVILSDGWDRGDPEQLREEIERLRRCAHRLIWVNPHAAAADFEPLTRGMMAALPSTDHLTAANSLATLEDLAELMESIA